MNELRPKSSVPAWDPNKFDLRTHVWNGQGQLIHENHYRLHNVDGRNYYERPVNSGNLWFENNQPAGRVEYEFGDGGKIAKKKLLVGDNAVPHKDFVAPLSANDKMHFELEQAKEELAAAKAELAAIQKERAARMVEKVEEPVAEAKKVPSLKKSGG